MSIAISPSAGRASEESRNGRDNAALLERIRRYWEENIHDSRIAKHPAGSKAFFDELEEYHFEKLSYLPRIVSFASFRGKRVLEVGCGIGVDLVRFARQGAIVTGIDLSRTAIDLARKNFALRGLAGDLRVMNGEAMEFEGESFDAVYAHGVIQYTADPARMISEIHRVLRPGGQAILTVYNKYSWLNLLSKIAGVGLEHQDAPAFKKYSAREFRKMLDGFSQVEITIERFPVRTRLHGGLKGALYNRVFVSAFNAMPRSLVRRFGWHIAAKATK